MKPRWYYPDSQRLIAIRSCALMPVLARVRATEWRFDGDQDGQKRAAAVRDGGRASVMISPISGGVA